MGYHMLILLIYFNKFKIYYIQIWIQIQVQVQGEIVILFIIYKI